jgi:hypothetical protein
MRPMLVPRMQSCSVSPHPPQRQGARQGVHSNLNVSPTYAEWRCSSEHLPGQRGSDFYPHQESAGACVLRMRQQGARIDQQYQHEQRTIVPSSDNSTDKRGMEVHQETRWKMYMGDLIGGRNVDYAAGSLTLTITLYIILDKSTSSEPL